MERKTQIHAEDGKQELMITREFDLPIDLLFRAYTETEFIEQWMNTKVIKLENKPHGSWRYETSNQEGVVVFSANGVIHEFSPNDRIIRTFEMENANFGVQLEFLVFEKISEDKSSINIQQIYQSIELRDQMLKLPFSFGLNMAHDKLQQIANSLK